MSGKLIIFGIGYVGRHLAEALLKDGWEIVGTCRSHSTRDALSDLKIHVELFDGSRPFSNWEDFSLGATHVLHSVPTSGGNTDPVYHHYAHRLTALKPSWFGYLSTTGVYGDHNGEWVDENAQTLATQPRALARLEAEKAWSDLDMPTHIFRLAGIYGPGRSAIDNLYQGNTRNIDKPGHVFSRAHVTDIVRILTASMQRPNPKRIYNVADDEPTSGSDVIEYAAKLIGLSAPPRIEAATATLSDTAKGFYENNKKIRNDRIKNELGVTLKYPTYREGLRAVLTQRIAASNS